MKPDPLDSDLRAHFQVQRRVDHESCPAWNPPQVHSLVRDTTLTWFRYLAVSAATVALILSGMYLMKENQVGQPSLTEALPVLLNQPAEPLFANLETAQQAVSSDYLLPSRFTIQLP